MYACKRHPKHIKFAVTNIREKPADLFPCTTRASTLAPTIILQTLGSFAKVFVPVKL